MKQMAKHRRKKLLGVFSLWMAASLLLSGCDESPTIGYFYSTTGTNYAKDQTFPLVNDFKGGVLLRTRGQDLVDHLNLWKGDTVTELAAQEELYGLTAVGGELYYWKSDGVYCFDPDAGTSIRLFAFDGKPFVDRFWGSGHFLYAVTQTIDGQDYHFYRYNLKTRKGQSVDWLDGLGTFLTFHAVIGDQLLIGVRDREYPALWLDVRDGTTRPCTVQRPVVGYRDGSLILYRRDEEDLVLHDVETCEETPLSIPEEIRASDNYRLVAAGDAIYWLRTEEYLLTLEEAVYQPFDPLLEHGYTCTLYRQTGDEAEPVFEYIGVPSDTLSYWQLDGNTLYFALYGYPSEDYPVVDPIDHDPEQPQPVMTFAALKPDGTVYLLAEEYYPYPTA